MTADLWYFGYSSLIWKVDFPYVEKVVGYVCNYTLRFWQGSTVHRGTPEKPGRVATLIYTGNKTDKVLGVAYRIDSNYADTTLANLRYRERGGYTEHTTEFYPKDCTSEKRTAVLFIAEPSNHNFLGPAPLGEIAETIAYSRGPSGENSEYLFNLLKALRTIDPDYYDEHLFKLEKMVLKILEETCKTTNSRLHLG